MRLLSQVKKTWAQDIKVKQWGFDIAARIAYRLRNPERTPDNDDIAAMMLNPREVKSITDEDVVKAFETGKEVSHCTMRAPFFDDRHC